MAVFSKIAYLKVPKFELAHHGGVKVIPCLTYQEILRSGQEILLDEFLIQADLSFQFVVATAEAVAVGVIAGDLIVISLRGTRPLYLSDWAIDFRATRARVSTSDRVLRVHTGFLLAMSRFVGDLSYKLEHTIKNFDSPPPVYITGHSLGGALASLVYGLSGAAFRSRIVGGEAISHSMRFHSCYTFGMPRYGDQVTVQTLKPVFHTYNCNDLVPYVPPRWLGFSDPVNERLISQRALHYGVTRESLGMASLLRRAKYARGLRHHFIERYIRQMDVLM